MSDDVDAPIKYSGVVYNEMKGVYSSADQTNYKAVRQALYQGHPIYSIDSGGDPRAIPTLTYDAFSDFHRKYYHPSNGFFYVYGDPDELPHTERLALLDEYLREYKARLLTRPRTRPKPKPKPKPKPRPRPRPRPKPKPNSLALTLSLTLSRSPPRSRASRGSRWSMRRTRSQQATQWTPPPPAHRRRPVLAPYSPRTRPSRVGGEIITVMAG
jgi:Zn-dependent M16 (insulinase) family peptidase